MLTVKSTLILIAITTLFAGAPGYGQDIKRGDTETIDAFAARNAPLQSELVHTVIQTTAWDTPNSVIAFYKRDVKEGSTPETIVDGYLFLPRSAGNYEKILIHHFEEEGDTARIEAVFFANADRDPAKELVVLCSWKQNHAIVKGTLYGTFVFDDVRAGSHPAELTLLQGISDKVSGGCDCWFESGQKADKRFRTAAQVRAGLKRLGF